MKLKYYLRGLGIGIFATVIILTIASLGKNKDLTDEEIIARAKELGMVMEDRSGSIMDHLEEDPSQGQPSGMEDGSQGPGGEGGGAGGDVQQPEDGQPQDADESEAGSDAEDTDPVTARPQGDGQESSYVTLSVGQGEYSDRISAKLKEAGLIEDAEEFNWFLIDSGIDDLIHVGTYRIPKGATQQEIADILKQAPNGEA